MPSYTVSKLDPETQLVCFQGRITFGWETENCRQKMKDLLTQGTKGFIFDLEKVEYVDSAGIGFLVSCLITLRQGGARLKLASPPERIRHVLEITRLDTIFQVCESREEAQRAST